MLWMKRREKTMKSRNKKRLLALVLCMVVAISNSSFIFASENGQTEYPQEAEVQTQDEAVADDMDVAAYAADEGQAVAEEQTAPVEQVAAEPVAEQEATVAAPAEQPTTEAPAAETPAAQEPAAAPTEETAPAAENATAETPEEDATQAETENQQLTWSQSVGDTTVNVTAEAGALPADAQLSVTEITSEDEVKEIEKAVEEKAIEEQFSIKNIFSYDIKFLVNGSEVQPTTPVQVSVDTPEITSSENAAVLHVDDNNVAEDMKGAVDGEGKVVFDAPHFSKYVIVQKGNSKVNVTIEYYDDTQNQKTMIYASKKELSPGESISNYDIADNWTFNRAEKITADEGTEYIQSLDALNNNKITRDCTIKVYYTPNNGNLTGSTKFYDYTVKAGEENGKYYSFNQLKNNESPDIDNNQKLIAGSNDPGVKHNYPEYQKYKISLKDSENHTKDANCYTGGDSTIPKLLKGIDKNGNVIFNYAEPGFFVDSDSYYTTSQNEKRYLRKVYSEYTLKFDRRGDTYTFSNVQKNGHWVVNAGSNFYPLDGERLYYEESETYHNYYFGMRYDVTFKIGDYVGPLNYKFTGDDDLWVVLDGREIVIDLGGIHKAATGNVDLWNYIGEAANLSEAAKQQNHTLTILYMERGAYESNCQMEFTLPSAKIQQVDQTKMTNISFYKTDANGTGLPDAQFTLTNDKTNTTMYAASASDGLVQFQQLVEGNYTLTETQAPKDYVIPTTSWKVKVTADRSGDLSARIYQADGVTELGKTSGNEYQVINTKSTPTPTPTPTPGTVETKKELSHEKYIAKKEDGSYNLTLNVSGAVGSETYSFNGTNANELQNAFDTIIRDATELLCTNVTVTDTLTDEVELVNNDLTVVVKDEAGNEIKQLKDSDGTKVDVSKIITTKIQTDANGKKQIIMRFKSDYKLESGYTYYVTAKIKPTDQAYLKYQENGYTDTGDEFTDEYLRADKKPQKDTRNDGTSSKQEGFKSNVSADVRYTYNGVTDTKSYKDPVIQVDNETVSHTVEKQWEDGLNKVAIQVELKAYVIEAVDKSVNAENPKYLIATEMKNLPATDAMQVTLSDTSGWNHTWENLPKYYFYKEGDTIKRTKVHYTVEEIASEATSGFYGKITESDDGTKTTILNKANDVENQPFIEVTKTFEGLTNSQIDEMANSEKPYTITVTNVGTGKSYSLTMDKDHLNEYLKGSETTWTYTWKLEGWSEGTYNVVESNYEKEGYEVSVTVDGKPIAEWNNIRVSTKQTEMAYEPSVRENKCSSNTFKIGKVNLIVAQLTSSEGYFVWTSEEISVNERLAIIALINAKDKIGVSPTATLNNSYFYSGTGIENTLVFRNGEIKYDGKQNLQFDASKQWTMFAAGTYTLTNAHNAEITVKNTYEEKTVDLDLVKTSVAGTRFDGAEFKLYKKNDKGVYELQKFEYTDESKNNQTRETIQVINTDGSEAELKNLQSGQYYLEEVKAPEACMLLADKIYFKQEKGVITLTDKNGKELENQPTMWKLSNPAGKYTLTVKNEIVYDLPSTGHSGIFNIMMSGILLMFAGILIIYKMKGKEVLKK